MRGHQCLLSSRSALPRVLSRGELQQASRQLSPWLTPRSRSLASPLCPSRVRYLSITTPRTKKKDEVAQKEQEFRQEEVVDRRWTTEASLEKTGRSRWPWDHEITDPLIMIYENGSVEGPHNTQFALSKIEPHESLRMVTPYEPANPEKGTQQKYPLCKIVEKDAEFKKAREAQLAKKSEKGNNKGGKVKEFEITWASTDHDTAIKVKRITDVLAKGYAVSVTLSSKKKKKRKDVSTIDYEHVLKQLKEGVEAGGGKMKKPQDGELGETVKLSYEPAPVAKSKPKAEENQ